jgi:hypothetical protein
MGRKGLSHHRWLVGGQRGLLRKQWGLSVGWAALHQKSFLYRIFWNKNRTLWLRKSLQNETEKVLLTGESAY